MRRTHSSPNPILTSEERLRVADFLLLLITIDRRLTANKKAAKATKQSAIAKATADKENAHDIGSRLSRALFIYFFRELTLISKPTACKTVLSELKRGFPALESILYRFCLLRSVFSAK